MFITWRKFYKLKDQIYNLENEKKELLKTLDLTEAKIQEISQRLDIILEGKCEEATKISG